MVERKKATSEYLQQLREIAQGKLFNEETRRIEIAWGGYPWVKKVRIWNNGGWAELSPNERQNINQRVERLRGLLPKEEHQTQLDAFYLNWREDEICEDICFLNKNLYGILLDLEKVASERNPA